MTTPLYKKYHLSKPKNISYIKGDIVSVIDATINNRSSVASNFLIPECYSLDSRDDSKFAHTIFELLPQLKINLDMYCLSGAKNYGTVQFVEIPNVNGKNFGKIIFANMICKKHSKNYRSLDYIALSKTMESVCSYLNKNRKNELDDINIITTKFGCGKSGGEWNFIEKLIEDAWANYNVQVYYGSH